jgi:hypothetical protein
MGVLRHVKPDSVRLALDAEDWIEIKRELSVRDRTRAYANAFRGYTKEGRQDVDLELATYGRPLAYLVAWSLPVAISADSIGALDPDALKAINDALDRHEEALEQEKKARSGGTSSGASSPSVS